MAFIESGKTFDKDENHKKLKKRMENLECAQYPLRIPVKLYRKVKIKLATDNQKLRGLLISFLEEYVKK